MQRAKKYKGVKFPPETIANATRLFADSLAARRADSSARVSWSWQIERENESWSPESEEQFAADYRDRTVRAARVRVGAHPFSLTISVNPIYTNVDLETATNDDALRVLRVFDEVEYQYRQPQEIVQRNVASELTIFIGHGRSPQWKDLKNFLQDKHGFNVTAYDTGPRAGLTMVRILEELSQDASFAILIHTAEDLDADGTLHARDNVIHETGLFQGKLGFERAIVLLEEGCSEFSNLLGLQQIRYSRDNIIETFGEVVATVFREFGD